VEQGAATTVWCATSTQLDGLGGLYCENCDVAALMSEIPTTMNTPDTRRLVGVLPHAVDPEAAKRLWTLSEELVFGEK
jgi:hypothetical protein